jgi:L-fuculose-phosphate aldolase
MMREELMRRAELVKLGHFLYDRGFIAGISGNCSARLDESSFLITPTGRCKGELAPVDLIIVRLNGPIPEMASVEAKVHCAIYKTRGDVGAIIHAHPPFLTGLALAHIGLDKPILPGSGPIPLIPYYPAGSQLLAQAVAERIRKHDGLILANHGVIVVGKDLKQTRFRLEQAELMARAFSIARGLGGEHPIAAE